MRLIVGGAAVGAAAACAVATCLTGAAILASAPDPLQAVTDANALVSLLTAALVAHVLVSVPLGVLGGALAGYQAVAGGAPRTRGQWTRRGGLVGALIGMAASTLYGVLMGAAMVFGIVGTVSGLISGALVGAWCHRVDSRRRFDTT
jgi:hypothetical protein